MHSHGSSLHEILLSVKQQTLDEAKLKLADRGLRWRVFDEFPCLLPKKRIATLAESFKDVLEHIPFGAVIKTDDGLELDSPYNKRQICNWVKVVIHIARSELLDENDTIKADLARLLQWEQTLTQDDVFCVICAYVGAINQEVVSQYQPDLPAILAVVLNFISTHYGQWVREVMNEPRQVMRTELYQAEVGSYLDLKAHPLIGLSLLAAGLAGAAVYGATNKSNHARSHRCDDEHLEHEKEPSASPGKNQF